MEKYLKISIRESTAPMDCWGPTHARRPNWKLCIWWKRSHCIWLNIFHYLSGRPIFHCFASRVSTSSRARCCCWDGRRRSRRRRPSSSSFCSERGSCRCWIGCWSGRPLWWFSRRCLSLLLIQHWRLKGKILHSWCINVDIDRYPLWSEQILRKEDCSYRWLEVLRERLER